MAKRKRSKKINHNDFSGYRKQFVSNSYILVNPAFNVDIVFNLLSVRNKVKSNMLIVGKPEDFKDNPNEVYRVIKQKKTIELYEPNKNIKKENESDDTD